MTDTTPITQTLPNSMYVWFMKRARVKGYKNAQSLIFEVLRDYKEREETPEEKQTYKTN